ncbi:MAG: tetratricopeptide repeat protein [Planctomycetota bacterium]
MKTAAATLAVLLLALPAAADRVLTKDGRVLHPKKARAEGSGYRFVFENGEIVVADKAVVSSVEIEGDMSEYVPQNDDEREKLAQGYVKYKGKWLSKPAYEGELRREFEASRKRTEELAKHSDWSNAWSKETKHFVVQSNTSPELLDYYCELMEAYYSLMDERIGINPSPTMRRTKLAVNIFKSRDEFRELSDWGEGSMPGGVIGFFSPMGKSLNFFHDYEDPDRTTWVGLHECTHLLTFLVDQQYRPQIWVNEGVADYFGSSKVGRDAKGKIVITPGELQTDRVLTVQQAIAASRGKAPATGDAGNGEETGGPKGPKKKREGRKSTTLEELFMMPREKFDGFEYAHAWSFVYFLNNFEGGKYAKPFARFFKGLYSLEKPLKVDTSGGGKSVSPQDIRAYLLSKLGLKDTVELEKQWKDFVAAVPIEGPTARLKRGLSSVRQLEFEDALDDLDAAIAGGTQDPRAWWARGRALAATGKRKQAQEDLAKAVLLEPLNAGFRYELSRLMSGRITLLSSDGGGIKIVESDEQKKIQNPEARVHAGLATELDPENDSFREWFDRFEAP